MSERLWFVTFGDTLSSHVVWSTTDVSPYTISELDGSSVVQVIVTHVLVIAVVGTDGTGAVSSITNIGELTLLLVFPTGSVTVIVLLVPSRSQPVAVAVQSTSPFAGVGVGAHTIHGTVTVVPGSTFESASVIFVHVCAGLGLKLTTVGSVGSVISIITGQSPIVGVGQLPIAS